MQQILRGNDMLFQIRDITVARKVLQTDSKDEVIQFLAIRNPDLYEVFVLKPLSMEVRYITGARSFLNGTSKTEVANG
jgi:hypothetical protein